MKGFYIADSHKIKLQVCKRPLSLSWQLCMTVCFRVNRVCNSSAIGAGTVQTMSAFSVFPFYLQIHYIYYIISFLFITVLSFQNVSKLLAFHLWDACFLSPFLPLSLTQNNQKNQNSECCCEEKAMFP